MNAKKWGAVIAVIVLAIGAAIYYFNQTPQPAPAESPPPPVAAEEVAPPPPDYPVPAPPPDAPALPALAESDQGIGAALAALVGNKPFENYLIPEMLIRRIVVTIDNLPRDQVALKLRPFKPAPPPLLVTRFDGRILLSPKNAERYAPQVAFFTSIDADKLAELYFHWYPLFERAYVDLGYPGKSFNNRLVAVIDNLLSTPVPPEEIVLVQPAVMYQFADPQLERLSIGQKMILRLSPAQRAGVLNQLRALRTAIVNQAPAAE